MSAVRHPARNDCILALAAADGLSLSDVAGRVGVTRNVVAGVLYRAGRRKVPPIAKNAVRNEVIIGLAEEGVALRDIAARMAVSRNVVAGVLYREGVRKEDLVDPPSTMAGRLDALRARMNCVLAECVGVR